MRTLKEKLNQKENILGTWVISPSVHSLNAICSSGIDFVILDQEHGSISANNLLPLINTVRANNCNALVRPASINKYAIQQALDNGADGIQVPNVENERDARRVVEYSKYPPVGTRGYSPFVPSSNYTNNGSKWNIEMNNKLVTGINVEGEEGISNIDLIMKIKELDVIFVGLFDLSKALGIAGDVENILVTEKLKEVIQTGNQYGKSIGTIATSVEHMQFLMKTGVNFIVYMVDMNVLHSSYETIYNRFKEMC